MDTLLIALIFYIAGAITRTLVAYLLKVLSTPDDQLKFDTKYWVTLIISIVLTIVTGIGAFSAVSSTIPVGASILAVFMMTFPAGYAISDLTNRGVNTIQENAANKATAQAEQAEATAETPLPPPPADKSKETV